MNRDEEDLKALYDEEEFYAEAFATEPGLA